jgi:hypothetical protein
MGKLTDEQLKALKEKFNVKKQNKKMVKKL